MIALGLARLAPPCTTVVTCGPSRERVWRRGSNFHEGRLRPACHVHVESRISWMELHEKMRRSPATAVILRDTKKLASVAPAGGSERSVIAEAVFSRLTDVYVTAGPAESALVQKLRNGARTHEAHPSIAGRSEAAGLRAEIADIDIVTAGRIAPQKAPELFACVISELRTRFPNCAVVWIGDGDAAARRTLEQAGVEVTGWLSPDQTLETMSRSRVYLHTAAWEAGIAYSIIEAASIGLPVVARDKPEVRDRPGALIFDTAEEGARMLGILLDDETKYRDATLAYTPDRPRRMTSETGRVAHCCVHARVRNSRSAVNTAISGKRGYGMRVSNPAQPAGAAPFPIDPELSLRREGEL